MHAWSDTLDMIWELTLYYVKVYKDRPDMQAFDNIHNIVSRTNNF